MRRFIYLLTVSLYTGAVFMAGMLVGQLYALYVLVYTGAVFMIGLWVGQQRERAWLVRQKMKEAEDCEAGDETRKAEDLRMPSEATFRH